MPIEPKSWSLEEQKTRELIAEESALMTLKGVGINEQVKQLSASYDQSLTRTMLYKLRNHPKYREVLFNAAEAGKLDLKAGAAQLVPDVLKCLKLKLTEGDVRAATTVFNILADKNEENGPKQAQQIQVILAGDTKEIK